MIIIEHGMPSLHCNLRGGGGGGGDHNRHYPGQFSIDQFIVGNVRPRNLCPVLIVSPWGRGGVTAVLWSQNKVPSNPLVRFRATVAEKNLSSPA